MADKNILVVDDDYNVHEILEMYLKEENYKMISAYNGEEALEKLNNNKIDLIVLDIMMPKMDGKEVVKEIRKDNEVAIIFLSAKSEEFDRVLGLELGADDYVTKPFSPREMVVRIKTVLKRIDSNQSNNNVTEREIIEYPNLKIDLSDREVKVKGEVIDLSPKEFELLILLARNPRQVFERDHLYERIWGLDHYGDMRTVDVHINWLRDKLDLDYIKTVWGVGYKFVSDSDV
ncbi:response regulator transcription factor [Halanaerobacter jeridensis]|uniref:Stage 0 sporulation protein A homolog n=1 Tax=Halanaerobacter jeridensis TaxID=706427 RepID=A0A938XNH6_9FIRM|nr:response regulator transcription factor [Halanaerobacter jeridensis]MBM7555447.1 two-component system response regulator ResD [Halanaerobacter jeridensis]